MVYRHTYWFPSQLHNSLRISASSKGARRSSYRKPNCKTLKRRKVRNMKRCKAREWQRSARRDGRRVGRTHSEKAQLHARTKSQKRWRTQISRNQIEVSKESTSSKSRLLPSRKRARREGRWDCTKKWEIPIFCNVQETALQLAPQMRSRQMHSQLHSWPNFNNDCWIHPARQPSSTINKCVNCTTFNNMLLCWIVRFQR